MSLIDLNYMDEKQRETLKNVSEQYDNPFETADLVIVLFFVVAFLFVIFKQGI